MTDERAARVLVSFDIDGTMEFGEPPGPVPAAVARELFDRGYIVGVASDWPRSSQAPLWARYGMEPHFVGGKHHLHEVRAEFEADQYIHVGDTDGSVSPAHHRPTAGRRWSFRNEDGARHDRRQAKMAR